LGCRGSNLIQNGDATQIYEQKHWIHGVTQGEWHVATYFHQLHAFWQELDHNQNFHAADAMKIQKMVEEGREFLAGLNSEYAQVRVHILGKKPLPSLLEAIAYVQNEDSHQGVILHFSSQDQSAFTIASYHTRKGDSDSRKAMDTTQDEKDKLFCDHC
jgi:hypothetical protein